MPRKAPQQPRSATQTHAPVSAAGQASARASGGRSGPKAVECVDCAALPLKADVPLRAGGTVGTDYRPTSPRPIHADAGPRKPRCATHHRAAIRSSRQKVSDARSRKRSGLDDDTRVALWALQGFRCPCGAKPSRGVPDADHDHELARQHDHPEERACKRCMRGFLCRRCNREVVGRLTSTQLRALADYLDDPPMRRLLSSQHHIM